MTTRHPGRPLARAVRTQSRREQTRASRRARGACSTRRRRSRGSAPGRTRHRACSPSDGRSRRAGASRSSRAKTNCRTSAMRNVGALIPRRLVPTRRRSTHVTRGGRRRRRRSPTPRRSWTTTPASARAKVRGRRVATMSTTGCRIWKLFPKSTWSRTAGQGEEDAARRVGRSPSMDRGGPDVHEAPPEAHVLDDGRAVEAELLADARHVGRARLRPRDHARRVARQEFVDRERDRHDRPDDADAPRRCVARGRSRERPPEAPLEARRASVDPDAGDSSGHTGCGAKAAHVRLANVEGWYEYVKAHGASSQRMLARFAVEGAFAGRGRARGARAPRGRRSAAFE